jgi:general secretion pathway protein N
MSKWLLAFLALGLGGVLFWQWSDWPPPAVVVQAPEGPADIQPGTESDPSQALAPMEHIEDYAVVKERPLFRPDRRPRVDDPADMEAPPPPEEAAKLDGMDLAGVLLSPGVAMAWVKDPSQPAPVRVRPGEVLGGWTVKDIQPDRLVLERQGATDTLPLRTFNAPWASPPPPPPAPKQAQGGKPPEGKASEKPSAPARPPTPAAKQRAANVPPGPSSPVRPGVVPPRVGRPTAPAR